MAGYGIPGKIGAAIAIVDGIGCKSILLFLGFFVAYSVRTAERAFLGVLLHRYKFIFLTQNSAF